RRAQSVCRVFRTLHRIAMGKLQSIRPHGAAAGVRDRSIHLAGPAHERRRRCPRYAGLSAGTKRGPLMSIDRMQLLKERLAPLAPTLLDVIDESHLHAGHEGSKSGASHFRLIIWTEQFNGLSTLARHRL